LTHPTAARPSRVTTICAAVTALPWLDTRRR
jgi:hypothetical protein